MCSSDLIEITRHPAISHMNEEQFRAGHSCKRLYMCQNRLVGRTVLERDEDMAVHFKNDEGLFGHRQTDESIECFTKRLWQKDIEE